MKNLLIISYLFPPAGGTGTVRVSKFCKYLAAFGWTPVVLTSYDTGNLMDPSSLKDISNNTYIFRAPGILVRQFVRQHKMVSDRKIGKTALNQSTDKVIKTKFYKTLKSFIFNYFIIPDIDIFWAPFAVLKGFSLVRRFGIQAVFATGPSWSSMIVGYIIKKLTDIPLILDFRDSWALGLGLGWRCKWRGRIEGYLESKIVRCADKTIAVTSELLRDFHKRYPDITEKFVLITNGFDEADFSEINIPMAENSNSSREFFLITHTGTIKSSASPKHFLLAIRKLLDNSIISEKQIRIRFVGKIHKDLYGKYVYDYIRDYELENIVQINGFVPRGEIPKIQKESDLLIVFIDQDPTPGGPMSGKIYEYTAAYRPVLALVPENSTGIIDYLNKTGIGIWANFEDVNEISEKIKLLYETKGKFLKRNQEEITKYSRKHLTYQLAMVLDSCL